MSVRKRVAFSKASSEGVSEENPEEDKYDMRDQKQHTRYLQIVLMKQPGPAPQYRTPGRKYFTEKFLFSTFCKYLAI